MSTARTTTHGAAPPSAGEENDLLAALGEGDEAAFMTLVEGLGPVMLRVARARVGSRAVAEEVVQEAWVGVLESLPRFEGRSSLKTWVMRILKNIAARRAAQERRTVPFSALDDGELEADEPTVAAERFLDRRRRWAGHWVSAPRRWEELPEERLFAREAIAVAEGSMRALPPAQRAVVDLRDVEGWDASEVCELLEISDANQRVLLHRARARVRQALEEHLEA